jgi:hypothetical protein
METPIVEGRDGEPGFSIVEIRDYVGGYEYTLDSVNRIAHRMKLPANRGAAASSDARPAPPRPQLPNRPVKARQRTSRLEQSSKRA